MKNPTKWRFLSGVAFGAIEFITIISMISCPAPWAWGTGYSPVSISISTTVGLLLGGVAFSHVFLGKMTFRTHVLTTGIVGAHCLALAFYFNSVREIMPFIAFAAYGFALIGLALFVKLPANKHVVAAPMPHDIEIGRLPGPLARGEGERPAKQERAS